MIDVVGIGSIDQNYYQVACQNRKAIETMDNKVVTADFFDGLSEK